jgi:hypothetical protein
MKGRPRRRHVPRPFERWFFSLFINLEDWNDVDVDIDWLKKLRKIADNSGCRIVFDKNKHWRESVYLNDEKGRGPTILAGGSGNKKYGCTAILHELGHHTLEKRHQHPKDIEKAETAAWKIATGIAKEHQLPFVPHIKRRALYSYRIRKMPGSKRLIMKRPLPKSWKLELSRRSTLLSGGRGTLSLGKKGKRKTKKLIKKRTAKAERRKPVMQDE